MPVLRSSFPRRRAPIACPSWRVKQLFIPPTTEPAPKPAPRPLRITVLCRALLVREGLERALRDSPGAHPVLDTDRLQPDVYLWVAESGAGLDALSRASAADALRHAVLLDLAGSLGPISAGIHGFLGYLPPEVEVTHLVQVSVELLGIGRSARWERRRPAGIRARREAGGVLSARPGAL